MNLSDYNNQVLKRLTKRGVNTLNPTDYHIYRELLKNPSSTILYIKYPVYTIRYIAKCIMEDREI